MKVRNIIANRKGQGLTEYLVLLLLIAVISISAVKVLGGTIRDKIQLAQRHIEKDITLEERKK
jgi:hypothetical protein